ALQPRPLRQGERPALVHPCPARARALVEPRVGAAVPDRPGGLGAARPRARGAAQAADGLGAAGAAPARPLAAGPACGRGRRPELRRPGVAAHRTEAGLRRGAAAPGRAIVRPAPGPYAAHHRPPARSRRPAAHPGAAHRPPRHPLAPAGGRWLARRRWPPRGRGRVRHRRVAPHRPAGGPRALGAGARSSAPVRPASAALHGPRRRARRRFVVVRPPLVRRGDLRRGQAAPRRGDPTAVVGRRHRAHHAGAARPVLARRPAGRRPARTRRADAPPHGMVPQGGAHVQRRARRRPALALDRSGAFPDTAPHRRPRGSAARRAGPPDRPRLPRRV
ncbi:MAG: hypothetical protein AVDCRST_MAG08-1174, partial [uncultured Acetobacteraceae bacterium]